MAARGADQAFGGGIQFAVIRSRDELNNLLVYTGRYF